MPTTQTDPTANHRKVPVLFSSDPVVTIPIARSTEMEPQSQEVPPFDRFDRLVKQQAHKCYDKMPDPKPIDFEDICQEGYLAYVRAARRFDPRRGIKFITYFHWTLQHDFCGILKQCYRHREVELRPMDQDEEGLPDVEDTSRPFVRVKNLFNKNVRPKTLRFVRELLYPGAAFRAWLGRTYKRTNCQPHIMAKRLARFWAMSDDELDEILEEIREALD